MWKKITYMLLVILFVSHNAFAYFVDGRKLIEWGREVEKAERGDSSANFKDVFRFMGYVQGVADATEIMYCKKSKLSVQQLEIIVINYLNTHPEEWGSQANLIILNALKVAFPCQ